MRANDGVCSVEIANKYVGFFGQMNWCLFILQYCERHGLFPDIRLTGDSYLDPTKGPNWLEYYFDVLTPTTMEDVHKRIGDSPKSKPVIDAMEQLEKKIAPVEQQLTQVKMKSSEGNLRYPNMLNEQFDSLSHTVDNADNAPTEPEQKTYQDLNARLQKQLAAWQAIMKEDVPALNQLIQKADIPAINIAETK